MPNYSVTTPDNQNVSVTAPPNADSSSIFSFVKDALSGGSSQQSTSAPSQSVLGSIYSYGDGLKRQLNSFIADPGGTINLGVQRLKDQQNGLINAMQTAYPMAGQDSVLNTPAQQGVARSSLADYGTQVGMAGMTQTPKDYGIGHRPMSDAGGASRLHDLTTSYGEDIYGPNALQYFGSGDPREKSTLQILQSLRNKPDAPVSIYRGVPSNATDAAIGHGDWVTLDPKVAADYGSKVLQMQVPASHVTAWPDAMLEYGYFPPVK